MNLMIRNNTNIPLDDIGYMIENLPKLEEYLDEQLEYESDNGVKEALIVSHIKHKDYDEWIFRRAAS